MDFCRVQRLINKLGGSADFPAHNHEPQFVDDRLSQYGFYFWSDLMPHVPRNADWHYRHPARPGVYAISVVALGVIDNILQPVGAQHLLYIGSSKNIANRLCDTNHWLRKCELRFDAPDVALLVHVLLTDEYTWAERSLIRSLRPLLNKQHRNG